MFGVQFLFSGIAVRTKVTITMAQVNGPAVCMYR